VIDDGLPAAAVGARVAGALDDVGRLARTEALQERDQLLPLGWLDDVVGVEPEGVIAGGPRQGRIAGRGEVVHPDEVEHPRPERAGDLGRPIDAAGVHDDDLIEDVAHRFEAPWKVLLLVFHDHRQGDSCPPTARHAGPQRGRGV
jgi:hypothetical protein